MSPTVTHLHHLDRVLCQVFNRVNHRRWPSTVFAIVSRLGDGLFWYALMVAIPLVHGTAAIPLLLMMIANGLLCTALYQWLKERTRRPRPCDALPDLLRTVAPLDCYSFPSGHTLHAVGFTLLVVLVYPLWAPLLVPFTLLVACSRLVLGLHYPSDVLAGATIGATSATIAWMTGGMAGWW